MRRIWTLVALLCCVIAPSVQAEGDPYLTLYSGWAFTDGYSGIDEGPPVVGRWGDLNDGYNLGLALGKDVCGNRFEVEYFYRNNSAGDWTAGPIIGPYVTQDWRGRLNCHSLMFNAVHRFEQHTLCDIVTPYAGAGIGVAFLDGDFSTAAANMEVDDTEFAFQGILGLSTQLTQNVSLLTEYRYFGSTEATLVNTTAATQIGDFDYSSHNVLFGISIQR